MATRWEKQGIVFHVNGQFSWMAHHACVPVPHVLGDGRLRIYLAPRDADGKSRVGLIEVDVDDPTRLLHVQDRPVLDLGKRGCFDDSGVMPACLVDMGAELWMYYIGWNEGVTVPYRNAVGLAVSTDGGLTFERAFDGPLVDRTRDEPYFTASPFVLRSDDGWQMWYASTTRFVVVDGKPEPVYVVKYAESDDGIDWRRENHTCLVPSDDEEANARPWVVRDGDAWRMWYCYRGSRAYRTDPASSYRIGYAESTDGRNWTRQDDAAGIDVADSGWDSEMVTYPAIYRHEGRLHMLYNGNGFGMTGVGHAVAADD